MQESVFVPPEFAGSITAPMPSIVDRPPVDKNSLPTGEIPAAIRDGGLRGILVALDVDGTLISFDGEIERQLLDALHQLEKAGAHIVIATGRSIPAVLPMLHTLGLDEDWVICSNGAVTIKTAPETTVQHNNEYHHTPWGISYTIVNQETFDPTQAIDALAAALPDTLIGVEAVGRGFRVSQPFPEGELIGEQTIQTLEELKAHPVSRVILRAPNMEREEFCQRVANAGMESIEWDIGTTAWLDVSPAGTTKASALQKLCDTIGTTQQRCVAIGDGSNDITMLQWAGWGIAMGQARDDIKKAANTTTTEVNKSGTLRIIETLLTLNR